MSNIDLEKNNKAKSCSGVKKALFRATETNFKMAWAGKGRNSMEELIVDEF